VCRVSRYRISVEIDAPRAHVYDLFIDLTRMREWVGGVTSVTDVVGTPDQAGSTYVVHFGPMKSRTEVLVAERPTVFRTKFGTFLLRGESEAYFEDIQGRMTFPGVRALVVRKAGGQLLEQCPDV